MPSRWLCLIIVAFWLVMTGWLVWQDVWPHWEPGLPPPFTIDMEEEASGQQNEITWNVDRNGEDTLRAYTSVKYHEKSDTFSLHLNLKPRDLAREKAIFGGLAQLEVMDSDYRVSRRGELRGITLDAAFEPRVKGLAGKIEFKINGEVRDGLFEPNLEYSSPALSGKFALSAVPISQHGSVLLPLHPVQRIEGLRRGQTWRMPLLNVLEASLNGSEPVVYLNAEVLPEAVPLVLDRKQYDCLIIEYRGGEHQGKTWVDEKTGLVLRQEQRVAGDMWAMQRVSAPR